MKIPVAALFCLAFLTAASRASAAMPKLEDFHRCVEAYADFSGGGMWHNDVNQDCPQVLRDAYDAELPKEALESDAKSVADARGNCGAWSRSWSGGCIAFYKSLDAVLGNLKIRATCGESGAAESDKRKEQCALIAADEAKTAEAVKACTEGPRKDTDECRKFLDDTRQAEIDKRGLSLDACQKRSAGAATAMLPGAYSDRTTELCGFINQKELDRLQKACETETGEAKTNACRLKGMQADAIARSEAADKRAREIAGSYFTPLNAAPQPPGWKCPGGKCTDAPVKPGVKTPKQKQTEFANACAAKLGKGAGWTDAGKCFCTKNHPAAGPCAESAKTQAARKPPVDGPLPAAPAPLAPLAALKNFFTRAPGRPTGCYLQGTEKDSNGRYAHPIGCSQGDSGCVCSW